MSHEFKLKYDLINDTEKLKTEGNKSFSTQGSAKNICFVLLNGKIIFLNYGYLISGNYDPENAIILLTFTTHKVVLKGDRLALLFHQLSEHLPKRIITSDSRYKEIDDKENWIVYEIELTELGN